MTPCPFCGGEAVLIQQRQCYGHGEFILESYVRCQSCQARGPMLTDYDRLTDTDAGNLAVIKWTTRK